MTLLRHTLVKDDFQENRDTKRSIIGRSFVFYCKVSSFEYRIRASPL